MNESDLFAILIGGNPFQLVRTLWNRDLEIALGMTHPVATAMLPKYKSDDDNDNDNDDDDDENDDDDKEMAALWENYFDAIWLLYCCGIQPVP